MKSKRVWGIAIILLGFANLVLIITKPVNRVLSWCFALPGIVLFILANIMYAKERKASVYSDWDKGFDRTTTSAHDYFAGDFLGKGVIIEYHACPRCNAPTWRKIGLPYADRIGNMSQLWKCLRCKYEEERFA